MNTAELSKICRQVRRDIITMTANAGSGHPGGSLSAVELMTSVFYNHMRLDPKNPKWDGRDRFVLSKGHSAPCYYAVLASLGFIDRSEYANFRQLHSILQGIRTARKSPVWMLPPVPWDRAAPLLWVWPWALRSWARTHRSLHCWVTASARKGRFGRHLCQPPIISWTI